MSNGVKSEKKPAHENIPALIAWLDVQHRNCDVVEVRVALELTIEKVCQMAGMTIIPKKELNALIQDIQAVKAFTTSTMVAQSITDLVNHLEADLVSLPGHEQV